MRKSRKQQIAAPVSAHASLSSCILAQNGGLVVFSGVACLFCFFLSSTSYFSSFLSRLVNPLSFRAAADSCRRGGVKNSSHPIDTHTKNKLS